MWLDSFPLAGHEQAGRRPALVLSPIHYNRKAGLMLCCPVTRQAKGYPFEVEAAAAAGSSVTGVVLCDQVRNLDWKSRHAARMGVVSATCLANVSGMLKKLLP
ncbi:MAG TPA: type II toxin-antitoxin system PemK/MazF family toxin [Burkholderiaceae bacterium]|nr:type II toxin-antitoxin system PemK/MazF family toxin [Burkholderiaceae bacterium]